MVILNRTLAIVAVCTAGLSCASHSRVADELGALNSCRSAAPAVPVGWKSIDAGDNFVLALPACFQRDEGPPPGVHGGGMRWRCKDVTVELLWGMWGADSFEDTGTRCRGRIQGVPVLRKYAVVEGQPHALAWYLRGGPHEPMIAAYSAIAADSLLVQQIVSSGAGRPAR